MFERNPELRPVGAGFLLQPTGLGVLDALGLRDAALARGAIVTRLHGETARGRVVMDMRYADLHADAFGLGMTRGGLFALLHAQAGTLATVHTGAHIVAQVEGGRGLVDAIGTQHGPFDLSIIADGSHSGLRAASGLVARDPLYPWGAMWCLLPADGWPHPRELRQRYAGTRTMLGALPVGARPDRGDRHWLTFYYSLPGSAVDAFDVAALARMHEEIRSLWPELAERTRMLTDPAQLSLKRSWWR